MECGAKSLIERNAAKLANLEREWSVLGPLRPITFSVHVGDDETVARAFAREIESLGFHIDFSSVWPRGPWSVHATRSMEPTPTNVTYWENWFKARLEAWEHADEPGSIRFKGWYYPKRQAPAFAIDRRIFGTASASDAAGVWGAASAFERGRILFGQTLGYDPVTPKGKYIQLETTPKRSPFHLLPSHFLKRARAQRPHHAEATASKFAQWLYSVYADAQGRAQDREEGKQAEESIIAARRSAYACVDGNVLLGSFPDWRLVHNGMLTAEAAMPEYFTIGDLQVGTEPLRVLPDLIYANRRTGEIIIVEIKHSRMAIPSNLWPNIWGQLWCYAQLEQVRSAPRVTVIGEVWGDAWTRGNNRQPGDHLVCLRASVRRDPRRAAYDRFFRTLFDIYRGAD